ncbi:MAG: glycosyltransferase family 2 protein [Acidobacteria bacterium]|nr:glycosyltransferase family 2 protein [Acidobacteriota bacterium]
MIEIVLLTLFFGSALVVAYVYAGYPLLIFLMARLRPHPVSRVDVTPSVTIIIPVFNEENVVERKIRNCHDLDYPRDRLEVLFVSDGSTDSTEEIIRRHDQNGVRLLSLPRSGKAGALNSGVAAAESEIIIFTDANVELRPDAVRLLVRAFADDAVGGVSGKKKYIVRSGTDTTEQGENLYWRWDQWQKELESTIGSMFAADGSLYAVRKSLYVPIADPAQADDIAISTRVVLQGFRLIFDPEAVALEEAPAEGSNEFRRKIRVTNHSVLALLKLGSALWTSGFYSVELLSHKLIRHFVPFFLVLLLLSTAMLSIAGPWFLVLLLFQITFYGLAIAGALLRKTRGGEWKVFSIPYYFCLVNAAAFLGVLSIARGRRVREWSPRGT